MTSTKYFRDKNNTTVGIAARKLRLPKRYCAAPNRRRDNEISPIVEDVVFIPAVQRRCAVASNFGPRSKNKLHEKVKVAKANKAKAGSRQETR